MRAAKIEAEIGLYSWFGLSASCDGQEYEASLTNVEISSGRNGLKFVFEVQAQSSDSENEGGSGGASSDQGEAPSDDSSQSGADANSVSYTVKYLFEDVSGSGYVEDLSLRKTMSGLPGEYTKVSKPEQVVGFAAQDFSQTLIARDGSTVIEVKYSRITIDLRFSANGGSWKDGDSARTKTLSGKFGASVSAPQIEKAGSSFAGWSPAVQATFTEEAAYEAQWNAIKYAIEFNACAGSLSVSSQSVEYGNQALKTASALGLSRDGYIFAGWALSAGGARAYSDGAQISISGNVALYALWEEVVPEIQYADYSVNYYKQNVSGSGYELFQSNSFSGSVGDAVQAEVFDIEGFELESAPSAVVSADGSTAIEVKYKRKTITLTFVSEGSSPAFVSGLYGSPVAVPANPTRTGYLFKGWDSSIQATFAEDESYAALWEAKEFAIWYVHEEDGSEIEAYESSVRYGDTVLLKDASSLGYQRTNWTFKGWTAQSGGSSVQYSAGDAIEISGDLELYTVWERTPATETVSVTLLLSDGDLSIDCDDGWFYDSSSFTGNLYYMWYVDGNLIKQGDSAYELRFTKAIYSSGVHTVTLVLKKTDDAAFYRSATAIAEID